MILNKKNTTFIATSAAAHICNSLVEKMDINVSEKNKDGKNFFPDGEMYFCFPNIAVKENIIVFHSGAPEPNNGLIELEMILSHLKKIKNINVEIFFLYFPYGQQDEEFRKGEINMARNIIEKLTTYYGVNKIHIIDPHFGNRGWVKEYPLNSINVVKLLISKITEKYNNVFFLSPDEGGFRRTGISGTTKVRENSFDVDFKNTEYLKEIKNYNTVVVIDDLLETGKTILGIGEKIKNEYPEIKLIAAITHGVLEKGILNVKEFYDDLFLTNSINREAANVDISDIIISNLHYKNEK